MVTIKQKIVPFLWLEKDALAAAKFYTSIFKKSKIKNKLVLENTPSDTPGGKVEIVTIELAGQEFTLMAAGPLFKFNESISFVVNCATQKEIDYYWEKLSADPKAEQCGWLKDKYGLSWQIYPTILGKMQQDKDKTKVNRVNQAFMPMKKFDIAALKRAYAGK